MKIRIFNIFVMIYFSCFIFTLCLAQDGSKLKPGFLEISKIQSVTGFESELREYIEKQLPSGMAAEVDNMGNLIAGKSTGNVKTLILVSIDEPGYVISEIRDDGYMRVRPASRAPSTLFNQFHEGHYVDIITETGIVKGIVSIPSSHISRSKPNVLPLEEFIIDVGAENKSDILDLGIRHIDPLAAVKDFADLTGNRIAGPMISRKFPAFALLEVCKTLSPDKRRNITFVWTTQSANRNSGYARLFNQISPEKIILINSYTGQANRRTGEVNNPECKLGGGVLVPGIGQTTDANKSLLQEIIDTAAKNRITVLPSFNSPVFASRSFRNISQNNVQLGISVKNPGSLVEVIDLDDLQELINLVANAVK